MRKIITAFMMLLCAVCVASAANYLTFTAEEDNSTFGIMNKNNKPDAQYSLDGGETWTDFVGGRDITLAHKGDKALLRGVNPNGFSKAEESYTYFAMKGKVAASGSVMSLIDGLGLSTEIPGEYCFHDLFKECASLTQAPSLPATTLTKRCYSFMFYRCTGLTQTPELPATTLDYGCYEYMFYDCTGLTQASELPATTLAVACYVSMFMNCTSLTQAPELPATTLAEACYGNMFVACLSLTQAPKLPATTLAEACYAGMFYGCSNLTQAPELPVTTLAKRCYESMFYHCTSLTQAPELPATTLAQSCYYHMFEECTSLTQAPELPATTLTDYCYSSMFSGCTSLSEIRVSFDDWLVGNYPTDEWVKKVGSAGTFICPKALAREYGVNRIPNGWAVQYVDDTVAVETNYLTFTAEEDNSTFGIVNETNSPDVQYSIDGGTSWIALSGGKMVTLAHKGDKALLKGNNPQGFTKNRNQYSTFKMTGKVAASGSVMSLIDGMGLSTEIPNGYCFCRLFRNCTSLTQAPELPATSLTIYCYDAMFLGCTNLKQVPTLPATTLANFCYDGMFAGCTSLTQAPELPVTTLASGCYYSMFSDCTGLTQAPALPATTLADSCYMYMFSGCTGLSEIHVSFDDWLDGNNSTAYWVRNVARTGTFICPKDLPAEYGESRIPTGWTAQYVDDTVAIHDTVAVEANYLTFTAEEDGSSFGIVNNEGNNPDVQYSLDGGETWTTLAGGDTVVLAHKGDKALLRGGNSRIFSKGLSQYSSFTMTGKVAASGSVMSLIDGVGISTEVPGNYCFYSLFAGCTGLTQAPELPATTLTENCYRNMFSGCTGLTQTPELPATTLAGYCYLSMFSGCMGLTQAPELPATTLAEACYVAMFSDCTNLTQAPELPSTTLAQRCYESMFSGCTSLTLAPELPATNLAFGCYSHMFLGCTSLAQTPKLPATTLVASCYQSMFSDCVSLTSADLSFEQYVGERSCCNDMFRGCTNLTEIKVSFEEWGYGNLENPRWVENVAPTGTFICPKALALEYGVSRIPEGWTVKYIEDMPNYLTFTAEEDSSSFGIVNKVESYPEVTCSPDIWYSTDGGYSWNELKQGDTIPLKKGKKALLKGVNPKGVSIGRSEDILDGITYVSFVMSGKIAASGNVMSLVDGEGKTTQIPANYCFYGLFSGCESLTQAPVLPATMLTEYCYGEMFAGCTGLTEAPELPATDMKRGCYASMFSGCNLTQAPKLPALNLAPSCYGYMFSWNKMLTQAPELPATELADSCYDDMFLCCEKLVQAPILLATKLKPYCYSSMFEHCISLTQAPELIATELAPFCYCRMFHSCTGLTKAPELPDTKELVSDSYRFMFSYCSNLNTIKVHFKAWVEDNYSGYCWVNDVSPTGTFYCPRELPIEYGIARIPKGWNVVYIDDTVAGEPNYLTFTAEEDGSSFGIVNYYDNNPDVQYSLDGGKTWTALAGGDTVVLAHKGDKALLRGDNPQAFSGRVGYSSFTMTGKVAASGSVMSLIDGIGLSTASLIPDCLKSLFKDCASLTQAPELPSTDIDRNCYESMFAGCTSLTKAPALPATFLAGYCYRNLFSGCTNLSEINVSFTSWLGTDEWVKDVAPTGTFICPKALPLEYGTSRIPEGWTVKYIEDLANYLTFTAEEDSSSFGIVNKDNNPDVQYSLDGGETWTTLTQGDTVVLAHKGDKALLKGNNPEGFSKGWRQYSSFKMTGKVAASGSVMSLIDGLGLSTKIPSDFCFYKLFYNCTSLTQAPALPATTLADFCYRDMFEGCTGLTQAPKLPATTLAEGCYSSMFSGCISLTQAPELPATTLPTASNVEYGCYYGMFEGCTSLTQAPELPATTLTEGCYTDMFYGCTSLTQAPALPATTLAEGCYLGMFSNCTSLTQAPALPATTLAGHCYANMFRSCTSLTQAPELPATTLTDYCYDWMFFGCTSLSKINVSFATWSDYYSSTDGWVKDVAPTGTFICPKDLPLEYGVSRIPEGWTVKYIEDMANYLTFTAEEDGSTFGIVNEGENNPNVQYSLNGGETWNALVAGDTVTLAHKGDKALLKGVNPEGVSRDGQFSTFKMTGKVAASGSVMSLIDGTGLATEIPGYACFDRLFIGCTSLTKAPELSATTLAYGCYAHMFEGCTSLTQAPELPATTLAKECYFYMFYGCTSLTQAPELPATTLADFCYESMFRGCTSLTEAPELPATALKVYCYANMFRGCTSLTQAPELPATTLVSACYQYMFSGCTSLTQAPELPAPELLANSHAKISCYFGMFSECTNLSEISVAFVKWKDSTDRWECNTYRWVENVAPTGTFICPKALPLEYGVDRIPEGWTVKYIEDGSGVNTTLADNITVWSDDLTIFVRGAEGEVSLYDMSGKRVAVSNSKDEERALCVPSKGVYVVRTNNGTSDVLVR